MYRLAVGALAGIAALAGCLREKVPFCANGAYCPEPLVCTERAEPEYCGLPEQVAGCFQQIDETECTLPENTKGFCEKGLCKPCDTNNAACRYDGWVAMQPTPAVSFTALWVAGPRDVYVGGEGGVVTHWNGREWAELDNAGTTPVQALWGSAQDNIFALSQGAYRFDGSEFKDAPAAPPGVGLALWGAGPDDVFAAGVVGITGRFTGATWSWDMRTPQATLAGLWGTSNNDVFAVGSGGVVFHFANNTWTQQTTGTNHVLRGVWGAGSTNVYAVGGDVNSTRSVMLRYDGAWTDATATLPSETGSRLLRSIWGAAATDIYAVGTGGLIVRHDGTAWTVVQSPTTQQLNAVAGTSSEDVFAVGAGGTVLRYSGR